MIYNKEVEETHEFIQNEWWMTKKKETRRLFGIKWYTRTVEAKVNKEPTKQSKSIGFNK